MLFFLAILTITLLAGISFYMVLRTSEDGITIGELDNVYRLDRSYITVAPRDSWNDPD